MAIITKYCLTYKMNENEHLLINTVTGALDIIDTPSLNLINEVKAGNSDAISKKSQLYSDLQKRGYLFETPKDELALLQKVKSYSDFLYNNSFPSEFIILPTLGCNLRCTYCFEDDAQHVNHCKMTKEQLEGILKYIKEIKESHKEILEKNKQKLKIRIFGGEPLLPGNKELVIRILEFSRDNNVEVNIVSNGTLVDYYMETLVEFKDVINLQITLDGQKDIHDKRRIRADGKGTFDAICKNITKLIDNNIRIALRVNVDAENISGINEIEKIIIDNQWNKHGYVIPYFSPVVDFSGTSTTVLEESELLEGLLKSGYKTDGSSTFKSVVSPCIGYLNMFFNPHSKHKFCKTHYCGATSKNELCFSPDGLVTSCITYSGKGKHSIGTFDENGVTFDQEAYLAWTDRNVFKIQKCGNCKYAFLCGGGCPIKAIDQNGSMENVVCSDIKSTIDTYVNEVVIPTLTAGESA
ncbi:radical SAM/SPASM domain-containing protein [Lachnobacterium bovis]|uniref:radical SAM/SPASM domain-containing protein n=1 Tax=Lachnobacterium bovis TaxID=140626 RepID=UPI0003B599AB|nr:radical SAM protein [Lachnobacterium bovis]